MHSFRSLRQFEDMSDGHCTRLTRSEVLEDLRMLPRYRILFAVFLFALSVMPALADIDSANATLTCNAYSFSVSASGLSAGGSYVIDYTLDSSPNSGGFPITGSIPFTATSNIFNGTVTGSFPALTGSYSFSGTASMPGTKGGLTTIAVSPIGLTCGPSAPPPCSGQASISSGFNGTPINAGNWIWLNANFTAKGIPSTGARITFTGSTVTAEENGTLLSGATPNAEITFSPTATCSTTTFDSMTNTWLTTVPVKGDDEIFLTGLAMRVPSTGVPGGIKVGWIGTFSSNGVKGITIDWKWSAAVYSQFPNDYNALGVKAGHQTACGHANGDHVGTPEGINNNNQPWKDFVLGGARGGGGSNWTGSWSGTERVDPTASCPLK
jgi:hypothetical protein